MNRSRPKMISRAVRGAGGATQAAALLDALQPRIPPEAAHAAIVLFIYPEPSFRDKPDGEIVI